MEAHCQSRSAKRVASSGGPPPELHQAEDQIDLESWADWSPLENSRSTLHTTVPFLSKTTMDGLRVTILSTIALVDQLFSLGYLYVLTGKFNQDCIEVRTYCDQFNRIDSIMITFLSRFLEIFRHHKNQRRLSGSAHGLFFSTTLPAFDSILPDQALLTRSKL